MNFWERWKYYQLKTYECPRHKIVEKYKKKATAIRNAILGRRRND